MGNINGEGEGGVGGWGGEDTGLIISDGNEERQA